MLWRQRFREHVSNLRSRLYEIDVERLELDDVFSDGEHRGVDMLGLGMMAVVAQPFDTGGILYGQRVAESVLTAPQVGCDAAQAVPPHLCI